MRIGDVMSRKIRAIGEWEDIAVPDELDRFHHYQHIPVLDRVGRVLGLLSRADLVEEANKRGGSQSFRVADMMRGPAQTLREDDEIEHAGRLMLAHHVSLLPVVADDGKLTGVVTDAELLAVLSGSSPPARTLGAVTVGEVMTRAPVTVEPDTSLSEAARSMLEGGFRHLPVVDAEGEFVGMLSEHDVRQRLGTDLKGLSNALPEGLDEVVGNVMFPDPEPVRENATLLVALDMMADDRRTALPVLDANDRLVGILSYVDVLVWIRRQAEPLKAEPAPSPGM